MKDTLGKVNCGKSCIRFQRVEDLELDAFADLLAIARRARTVGGDSHDAASKKKSKATPKVKAPAKAKAKAKPKPKPKTTKPKAKKASGARSSARPARR
jgi:hypothetical protein